MVRPPPPQEADRDPPPPPFSILEYGQCAVGTHHTGMHSCSVRQLLVGSFPCLMRQWVAGLKAADFTLDHESTTIPPASAPNHAVVIVNGVVMIHLVYQKSNAYFVLMDEELDICNRNSILLPIAVAEWVARQTAEQEVGGSNPCMWGRRLAVMHQHYTPEKVSQQRWISGDVWYVRLQKVRIRQNPLWLWNPEETSPEVQNIIDIFGNPFQQIELIKRISPEIWMVI